MSQQLNLAKTVKGGQKNIRPKLDYPKKAVVEVVTSGEQVLNFNT